MNIRILHALVAASLAFGALLSVPIPTQAAVPTGFNFCNSSQKLAIEKAFSDAQTPLSSTYTYVSKLPDQGNKTSYEKFFGPVSNNTALSTVAANYGKIDTVLSSGNVTTFCGSESSQREVGGRTWDLCGSTNPASSLTLNSTMYMKLCPWFFDKPNRPATGLDSFAGVIIHEVSHLAAGTNDDGGYTCSKVKTNGTGNLSQGQQIVNADNYEYLAETYGMSASC